VRRGLVCIIALSSLFACDKLGGKKDADGGTATADPAGGGGILSFLDSKFEGDITMQISKPRENPKTFTFELKPPKFRIEAPPEVAGSAANNPMMAQGLSVILDTPAKKAYALIHAKKQAMVIDFAQMKNAKLPGVGIAGPSTPGGPPPDKPNIEKTGKKDTVAGYTCDIYKITQKDGRHAEACLAEGIKWFDLTDFGMQSPEMAFAASLSDMNHFPLRLVTFTAANAEESRMQATKIDKKKLEDSRFAVPPDYQVVDLAQMMQGLGKLPATPPARK
jgi:hypothetical protein